MNIPECMQHLPRWGEFPIPYTTPVEREGEKPNFRATDPEKHNLCCKYFLCGVCGKYIAKRPYYFVLGPMCVDLASVFGTPMHEPCARASLAMCPWLSRGYTERHALRDLKAGRGVPMEGIDPKDLPPKPMRLALAAVASYSTIVNPDNRMLYVLLPAAGAYPCEWWSYQDGTLKPEEARHDR